MTDRNPHYRIVEGADAWALETAVKALMDEGWTPQGGVGVAAGVGPGELRFFQAMTRNAKPVAPTVAEMVATLPLSEAVADPGVL